MDDNADKPRNSRIASPTDADGLLSSVIGTMAALETVLADETELVKVGRITEALNNEGRKTELAGAYMRGLEAVKANALALARYAPSAVVQLRQEHGRFAAAIEKNQAVLATARAVSEGLMRGLASELTGKKASGYGPAWRTGAALANKDSTPLAVSKQV